MAARHTASRWLAFNLVGFAGIVVQLAVLVAATRVGGLSVAVATLAAVEAALLHNFFWHQRWTWRDRRATATREILNRLTRFHAVNGVVSLVGNVAITTALVDAGADLVVANVAAISVCSLVNFAAGDLLVFRSPAIALCAVMTAAGVAPLHGQSSAALKGWHEYVATLDQRHADVASLQFFALDVRRVEEWRQRAGAGEVPMVEIEPPGITDAKMHHWAGAVFVPRTTVETVVKRLKDHAGRESESYEDVTASQLIERKGDSLRVFLKLKRDAQVMTVSYATEHAVEYRLAGRRATNRSVSTKIAELADAGTPREREKRPGDDHGFLWRLNAYWRYEQVGDGVLIECESVSLSRSVPFVARPLVGPIANRIARGSLERTLRSLRALLSRG
ncbi:MAG: GtrA family protein [Acidobacteria bacterium]|nr:GtrA family protein [Acidobacteriota bacterium]